MRIGIRMGVRIGIENILTPILLSLSFSLSLHSAHILSSSKNALLEYFYEPQYSLYRKVRYYGTVVCSAVADPAGAMAKIVAAFDV